MFYKISSAAILTVGLFALPAHAAPLTFADFGIYAATGPVVIGNNAKVAGPIGSGGDIDIGNNAEIGGIYAVGDVDIGNNASVGGIVSAGGSVAIGNNSNNPTVVPFAADAFGEVVLPGAVTPTNPGGPDVTGDNNQTRTLAAGEHGLLSLKNGATVNLSAGNYYFSNLDLGNNATLNFDFTLGAINIFVDGAAGFGNNVAWNLIAGDASKLLWEIGGDFMVDGGNNAKLAGTIYTSGIANIKNDNVDLDNNVSLIGALYSTGGISIGNNFNFTHVAYDWPATVAPVPLPAAFPLLLGGVGLLGAIAYRRRKTAA